MELIFFCKGTHNSPFFCKFAAIFNKYMKELLIVCVGSFFGGGARYWSVKPEVSDFWDDFDNLQKAKIVRCISPSL